MVAAFSAFWAGLSVTTGLGDAVGVGPTVGVADGLAVGITVGVGEGVPDGKLVALEDVAAPAPQAAATGSVTSSRAAASLQRAQDKVQAAIRQRGINLTLPTLPTSKCHLDKRGTL